MQFPPPGRHLDQTAPIAQDVVHLAVGVAGQAGVGRKPTRSGFRRTHKLLQDAHTSWPQILGQLADSMGLGGINARHLIREPASSRVTASPRSLRASFWRLGQGAEAGKGFA